MNTEEHVQELQEMLYDFARVWMDALYELALIWGLYALQTIIKPVLCVFFSCLLVESIYRLGFRHDPDEEVVPVDRGDDFWARLHHSAMLTGELRPHDINPFHQDRPYVTIMIAPILLYKFPLACLKFAYTIGSILTWILLFVIPFYLLTLEYLLIRRALRQAHYGLRQTLVFFNVRTRYHRFTLYLWRCGHTICVLLDGIIIQRLHPTTIRWITDVVRKVVIGSIGVILIVVAAKAIAQVNFKGSEIIISDWRQEAQSLQTIDRVLSTEWPTPEETTTFRSTTTARAVSQVERQTMTKKENMIATTAATELAVGIAGDSQEERNPETFTFFRNEEPRINRVQAHFHKRTYCPTCKQWHCCEMAATVNEV